MIIDSPMKTPIDKDKSPNNINEIEYLEKLFQEKENTNEEKITFGLIIIQHLQLNLSQHYQCVDFYDVEQGYIITCNVVNLDKSKLNVDDYLNRRQLHLRSTLIIKI